MIKFRAEELSFSHAINVSLKMCLQAVFDVDIEFPVESQIFSALYISRITVNESTSVEFLYYWAGSSFICHVFKVLHLVLKIGDLSASCVIFLKRLNQIRLKLYIGNG